MSDPAAWDYSVAQTLIPLTIAEFGPMGDDGGVAKIAEDSRAGHPGSKRPAASAEDLRRRRKAQRRARRRGRA